jgi:hypothetical protein
MEWIPAIDNLEARQGLESVDQTALATGNLEGAAADRVWDALTLPIKRWQPTQKRKTRKKGESPF